MKITVHDAKKDRRVVIGDYNSDINTLTLPKDRDKHFMKIYGGYGIQQEVYERALKLGATIVIDEIGGDVYASKIKDWEAHGITREHGHGAQRFLSLKYMQK
jgi:hypothetical protein